MRRTAWALGGLLLAACSSSEAFKEYRPPGAPWSLSVPAAWEVHTNLGSLGGKPETTTFFVSPDVPRFGVDWLGPSITVLRLSRRRDEHPGDDAAWKAYSQKRLAPVDALFKDLQTWVSTGTLAGLPSRRMLGEYEVSVPAKDGRVEQVPMLLDQTIVPRPEAFYVVELRAREEEFGRLRPIFERALSSFRFAP